MAINYCCFSHFNMAPIFHTLESELFLWMLWINIIWQKCCCVTWECLSAVSTIVFWNVPSRSTTTLPWEAQTMCRDHREKNLGTPADVPSWVSRWNKHRWHPCKWLSCAFQHNQVSKDCSSSYMEQRATWMSSISSISSIILRQNAVIVWSHEILRFFF